MDDGIILESWSPVCNIQAFVEKTDKNYYFYLWVKPDTDESEIKRNKAVLDMQPCSYAG